MKRKLNECPLYENSGLKDKNGKKIVNCALCAFGKGYGRKCIYPAEKCKKIGLIKWL